MTWPARLLRWHPDIVTVTTETGNRAAPELVAAIIDRESKGDPDVVGDFGHGHGLMQIDDRYHKAWLDLNLWRIPLENIRYGVSKVLLPNLDHFQGWPAAIAAFNAGWRRVQEIVTYFGQDVEMLDTVTAKKNYVSWVLNRVQELQG